MALEHINPEPVHLGDLVYASFDGSMIRLTTQPIDPLYEIYLDRQDFAALLRYAKSVGWEIEK